MTQAIPQADVAPKSLALVSTYMQPQAIQTLREFAAAMVASKLVPAHVATWQQAFAIMVAGDSLGIHPWTALSHCYVVHGKVGYETKLLLAMIQRTGLLEEFDIQGNHEKARCIMKRQGQKPVEAIITMEMAQKAGWTTQPAKEGGQRVAKQAWAGMPDLMLKNRAITRVARIAFADVVLGMYDPDELDIPVRVKDEEVVLDVEAIEPQAEPVDAPENPIKAEREAAAEAKKPPSEEQRKMLSALFAMKSPQGKPYVTAAQRKEWSSAIAKENTASMFSVAIDAVQSIVTDAQDREALAGEPAPAQGGLL